MILREYELKPTYFQEIELPEMNHILNVLYQDGRVVILAEVEEADCDLEKVGIFLVKTDDPMASEIPDNFYYLSTVQMYSEIGNVTFHAYVESPEYGFEDEEDEDLFDEPPF